MMYVWREICRRQSSHACVKPEDGRHDFFLADPTIHFLLVVLSGVHHPFLIWTSMAWRELRRKACSRMARS